MSAWGDTKICPVCRETIKAIAVRCRYCHTDFDTVNPLTLADIHRKTRTGEKLTKLQNAIIGLFVFNLIGCFAPIGLILNLAILLPQRRNIARLQPLFQILAYSALALSVLYSFLMFMCYLFKGT